MNSMTGFGRGSAQLGTHAIAVQVNSVNRRGLDLTVSLPDAWETLEGPIADAVRKVVTRGKVHVVVEVDGGALASEWDEAAIGETLDRLQDLAKARGVPFQPTAELLWEIASAQSGEGQLGEPDEAWPVVEQALAAALRGLGAMRAREGEALLVDFLGRLAKLHANVEAIAARAPQIPANYREQLLQRLRAAGLELDLNDERVLKEIALFADRVDVTEEITRLRSHLGQLKDLLRSDGEVGRKAEFILQEIGREIHTIGSKANDLPISQRVIDCKNELERVREQIANVE
jgi:uncharacterized protein (TIGR00255 family)